MTEYLRNFLDSLASSDRVFADDFDLFSVDYLVGGERTQAIAATLPLLTRAGDARAARALAALHATEARAELRMAAATGDASVRVEAARALLTLGDPEVDAKAVYQAVLAGGDRVTSAAKLRAVASAASLGPSAEDVLRTALDDGSYYVRAAAWDALVKMHGLYPLLVATGRLAALSERILCDCVPLRRAALTEIAVALREIAQGHGPDWSTPVQVDAPEFAALRERLVCSGAPDVLPIAAAELIGRPAAERELLWAWAATLAANGQMTVDGLVALGVPGAADLAAAHNPKTT